MDKVEKLSDKIEEMQDKINKTNNKDSEKNYMTFAPKEEVKTPKTKRVKKDRVRKFETEFYESRFKQINVRTVQELPTPKFTKKEILKDLYESTKENHKEPEEEKSLSKSAEEFFLIDDISEGNSASRIRVSHTQSSCRSEQKKRTVKIDLTTKVGYRPRNFDPDDNEEEKEQEMFQHNGWKVPSTILKEMPAKGNRWFKYGSYTGQAQYKDPRFMYIPELKWNIRLMPQECLTYTSRADWLNVFNSSNTSTAFQTTKYLPKITYNQEKRRFETNFHGKIDPFFVTYVAAFGVDLNRSKNIENLNSGGHP